MIGKILNSDNAKPAKKLIILGASGSVGTTALRFLRLNQKIELSAVSVHRSVEKLKLIISEFNVKHAAVTDEASFDSEIDSLKRQFPKCIFYRGESGSLDMIAGSSSDTILTAVVGACGIRATVLAIRLGMKIALANKETMVTAGPAIVDMICKLKNKPVILPVDSEHNSIFQLLEGVRPDHLSSIILTASGGPFRDMPLEQIKRVKKEQVLNHPTWSMGPKISVDSAGMINKGLEIIEAHQLFTVPYEKLDVFIHKKSIIHGMIRTVDGAYRLAGSSPDMIFPVAHALQYPDPAQDLNEFAMEPPDWPALDFLRVEKDRYPGFSLAVQAGKSGGTAPAVFNAANEIAVEMFLKGNIEFTDIPHLIELVLNNTEIKYGTELELYLEADLIAREKAGSSVKTFTH